MGGAPPRRYPQRQFRYINHRNVVVTQQPGSFPVVAGQAPADYMGPTIFVTLCCFWPTGIVAIMRANDARTASAFGDIPSATAQARSDRRMVIISFVIGIIALVIVAIIIGVYSGLAKRSASVTYS